MSNSKSFWLSHKENAPLEIIRRKIFQKSIIFFAKKGFASQIPRVEKHVFWNIYSAMSVFCLLKQNSPSPKNTWHIGCLKRWLLFLLNDDSHQVFQHSSGTLDGVKTKRASTKLTMKLVMKLKIGHLVLLYSRFVFNPVTVKVICKKNISMVQ